MMMDSFDKLDTLDISLCRSLTCFNSLLKLSRKLKWLNLYNCSFHAQINPTIYQILYQLTSLEYLDLSTDNQSSIMEISYDINQFLSEDNCLVYLKHFDLSGQKNIRAESLQQFLLSHSNLQFLGLFLTNTKYSPCLFDSTDSCYSKSRQYTYDLHDMISSPISDDHIQLYESCLILSLKRYNDRASFVQKILYYIFFLTRNYQSKNQKYLLELILHAMSIHKNLQSVQMASTACIYNLTRTPLTEQLNVKMLGKIIQAIIDVMELFSNQQQVNSFLSR